MRLSLALAVLACSAAAAHAAEDRYGPATSRGATASAYTGPLLGWTGKTAPPVAAPALAATQPLPGGLYRTLPPVPAARPQASAAPASALPTSLYDRPAARTPAAAQAAPALAPSPSPAPAPAPATNAYASGTPRLYSVHRAFGVEPDPIPPPPPGGSWAYRPDASLAGPVRASGAGDGVIPEGDRPASADDADWSAGETSPETRP